jgi:hypothetical protein
MSDNVAQLRDERNDNRLLTWYFDPASQTLPFLKTIDRMATAFTFQLARDREAEQPENGIEKLKKMLSEETQRAVFWTDEAGDDRIKLSHHGKFDDLLPVLMDMNRLGFGVFVTINETDGSGRRKKENIKKVRALWVDLDGTPLEAIREAPLKPHIIVETSPGKFHVYWIIDGLPLDHFTSVQLVLAEKYGGDPQVADLSRVMRLPGFNHKKGRSFRTHIIELEKDLEAYSAQEFLSVFEINPETVDCDAIRVRLGQKKPRKSRAALRLVTQDTALKDEIKQRLPFNELFAELHPDRAQSGGTPYNARCPFHDDRNPSFLVESDHGYCFAGCRPENGGDCWDIFDLYMELHDCGFRTALTALAARTGVEIPREQSFTAAHEKIIQDAFPRLGKKDFSILEDQQVLGALALARENKPSLYAEAYDKAPAGFKRRLEAAVKGGKLRVIEPGAERTVQNASESLLRLRKPVPKGCEEFILPPGYFFDESGIGRWVDRADGRHKQKVCSSWILVVRKSEDAHSRDQFLTVAYYDSRGWRYVTDSRSMFFDNRKLVSLADKGLPVSSDNSKELSKFLFEFETVNVELLVIGRVSSQCGWHDDCFLLGEDCIGDASLKFQGADSGDVQVAQGFHTAGSRDAWMEVARSALRYPRVAALFYGALTALMLRILNMSNFIIDLSGPTSTGKSISLKFALSAFGDPNELMRNWSMTANGFEGIASTQMDLPLGLDDTKTADPKQLKDLIYWITAGRGKTRGTLRGTRESRAWRAVVLSTGEAALDVYARAGGAQARILSLRGAPFGCADQSSREFANRLNTIVCANYGFVGRQFVEFLVGNRDQWPHWKERFEGLCNRYEAQSGAEARRLDIRAAIELTGALLHEQSILPGEFVSPFDEIWEDISCQMSEGNVARRALADTIDWIVGHREQFHGQNSSDRMPLTILGRWDARSNWEYVGVFRPELAKFLENAGYDVEAILLSWRDNGWLQGVDDSRYTRVVRMGRERPRMVPISREAIRDVNGTDLGSEEDLDE